jgi:hypothetical protein
VKEKSSLFFQGLWRNLCFLEMHIFLRSEAYLPCQWDSHCRARVPRGVGILSKNARAKTWMDVVSVAYFHGYGTHWFFCLSLSKTLTSQIKKEFYISWILYSLSGCSIDSAEELELQ